MLNFQAHQNLMIFNFWLYLIIPSLLYTILSFRILDIYKDKIHSFLLNIQCLSYYSVLEYILHFEFLYFRCMDKIQSYLINVQCLSYYSVLEYTFNLFSFLKSKFRGVPTKYSGLALLFRHYWHCIQILTFLDLEIIMNYQYLF